MSTEFFSVALLLLAIAGGIILFLIALRMVFRHPEGIIGDPPGAKPFLVPRAVPAIAGPSALATVMRVVSRDPERTAIGKKPCVERVSARMAPATCPGLEGR